MGYRQDALLKECNLKGSIINVAIQRVANTDDLVLMASNRKSLEEVTLLVRQKAEKDGCK